MAAVSSAHKFTVKKVKTQTLSPRSPSNGPSDFQVSVDAEAGDANSFDIESVHDLIYLANITVGGIEYGVQLDTGSSDLFIKGDTYPIPSTTETSTMHNLTYAIGWAYGHIAYSPVEFLGISVPSQAFVDASTANNPALGFGAQGIAGLGFTRLSSIDLALNGTQQSTGRSLLYNLFEANPAEPNFIAFALSRKGEAGSVNEVEGSFSIGEYEPEYAAVSGSVRIPTWPIHFPFRWNLLLDAVIVKDKITTPTTSVVGAPSNKAVVLMDSGSSYSSLNVQYRYVSEEVCNAIYGNVPGAAFDPSIGYWRVPCSAEINMALQIGGEVIPLHPLDVNPTTAFDPTMCIGSFVPQKIAIAKDFDWLIGDNVLRSVYSVYDFGDFDASGKMGDPYMKLFPLITPDGASAEFHKERGGTPKTGITFTGLNGQSIAPSFAISTDISDSLEMIGKFMPAMLGVVALNALIVIVCCIVWLVSFCRKRKSRPTARNPRARMSPMPMNPRNSYIAGLPPVQPHTYEPVSMALTEDTLFAPPSPAFHGFDSSKARPGDRPKSVA
ncbi:aspartic peptidase A1 [Crassisporium funariophilum]|nr:aspartic peptidase A1 [Crassisporium funariophilum]